MKRDATQVPDISAPDLAFFKRHLATGCSHDNDFVADREESGRST
jgi:hypothetical protein